MRSARKAELLFGLLVFGLVVTACSTGAKIIRQPLPEIVGVSARPSSPGFDYTVWVDCTVHNNGASGSLEVHAELRGGGYWKKRDTVHIAADAERTVTLAFPEATLLDTGLGGYQYNCGIN